MGLFVGKNAAPIDVMAVSKEMRKGVRLWQSAMVVLIDPNVTGALPLIIWSGLARVQPYRKDLSQNQVTNPTTTGTVRFQVDFAEDGVIPDVQTNFEVYVLPTALSGIEYPDPYISEYAHIITSGMNSSLAWVRTIETTVNTEAKPNYNIVPDGDGWKIV